MSLKPKRRSKNLGDGDIKQIVEILDGWSGRLSWDLLIDAIEIRMFNRYTRQALSKHERIRHAFELRKLDIRDELNSGEHVVSSPLQAAQEHIARLETENRRLEAENNQLLEQFARWAYNANARGLDFDFLNRALPLVNRGQTKR
ncbi:hypothetical protein [Pseudomonas aeruginosa]|uniref:hypothetical protein n=1 Tax=Pseudomonas aeruginosa TaxID=287 RepID=UPI001E65CCE3|nr:hypothetical protein [Pseudomonas aeruginosa]